jgi:hypothetical protein
MATKKRTKKKMIARKAKRNRTTRKKTVKRAIRRPAKRVAKKTVKEQSVRAPDKSVELREAPVATYEVVETQVYEEFVDRAAEEPEDESGAA